MAHVIVNSPPFDRRGLTQGKAIEAAGLGFQDKPGVKTSAPGQNFRFSSQLPPNTFLLLSCAQIQEPTLEGGIRTSILSPNGTHATAALGSGKWRSWQRRNW